VHMIFRGGGGSPARPPRWHEKLIRQEVFNADVAKPSYLKWSKVLITFDREDHPDHMPQVQKGPHDHDGWGKQDQRVLCVNA
jgi:hypothetical protein